MNPAVTPGDLQADSGVRVGSLGEVTLDWESEK